MALVVNERDVLLGAASSRLIGITLPPNVSVPALVGVSIKATSQLFSIPNSGPAFPTGITLTVIVGGLTSTPTLSVIDGTLATTPTLDSDYKFSFTEADMLSDIITFKAEVVEPDPLGGPSVTYSDTFTILKAYEGSGSVVGFLSNENFTVVADNAGNVASYTGANGRFHVINGITDITELCTFAVQDNPQSLTVAIDPATTGAGTYNVSGGFSSSDDVATVTFRATYGSLTLDKVFSLSKAKRGNTGSTGSPGTAGDMSSNVYLYAWSTAQPSNPNGSSSYTWGTASHTSFSGGTWSTSIGSNPGTPGIKLWVAAQAITAVGGTVSTTVTWNSSGAGYSVYAQGQNGNNGLDGLKSAQVVVFAQANSIPAPPSGSDSYTWSSGAFSGPSTIGSAWFFNPPTTPIPGFSLWQAAITLSDAVSATSTAFNWTSAVITARGYYGNNGATGSQGASARYGYARISGNPTPTTNNLPIAGDNLPNPSQSSSYWGASFNVTWTVNDPNPSSTSTLYQIDGIYDPVSGNTTWATPYISSLKVGSLSAVAVNTGSLNVNANITVAAGGYLVGGQYTSSSYPASGGGFYLGADRIRLGRLASGQWFEVTSAGDLSMPGLTIASGSATFSGNITSSTMTGGVVQTSSSGKRIVLNESNSNVARFYGDAGGGIELLASIGNPSPGNTFAVGTFGTNTSGNNTAGIAARSNSYIGVYGNSISLHGVYGSTSASLAQGGAGGQFDNLGAGYALKVNSASGPGATVTGGNGLAIRAIGDVQSTTSFQLIDSFATRVGEFYLNSGAVKVEGIGSVNVAIATNGGTCATFTPSYGMFVSGGFGCNGKSAQSAYPVNAAASGTAAVETLVNQLRAALIANGICV